MTDENDIKPVGGQEQTVTFRLESDRDLYEIRNPNVDESLIKITGYDLQVWFNPKYLKSVEDIEAACNGVHNLFRELIMEQMLNQSKQNPQE